MWAVNSTTTRKRDHYNIRVPTALRTNRRFSGIFRVFFFCYDFKNITFSYDFILPTRWSYKIRHIRERNNIVDIYIYTQYIKYVYIIIVSLSINLIKTRFHVPVIECNKHRLGSAIHARIHVEQ